MKRSKIQPIKMYQKHFIQILLGCILILLPRSAGAQDVDTTLMKKGPSIKINALQLLLGEVRLLGEYPFNRFHSIELISSYYFNYTLFKDFSWRSGFELGLGYRYYDRKPGKKGFYANPIISYRYVKYNNVGHRFASGEIFATASDGVCPRNERYNVTSQVYSFKSLLGWVFGKKLLIDIYWGLGIGYMNNRAVTIYGCAVSASVLTYDIYRVNVFNSVLPSMHTGINIGFTK